MAYFRLADVVAILEAAFDVAENRHKAFRERLNFLFRSTTILNGDLERPGRDRHDFHSFHRVATTLALMMVGLRVERCHHVIAPRWNSWLALSWAIAWQAATGKTEFRPLMIVGDDLGLEFSRGRGRALIVRLVPWAVAAREALPNTRIAARLHAWRVVDFAELATTFRDVLLGHHPSILDAFEQEARLVLKEDSFWRGALSKEGADADLDDAAPVPLSRDIPVNIAYEHYVSPVLLLERIAALKGLA
jgi:hypothetical protein